MVAPDRRSRWRSSRQLRDIIVAVTTLLASTRRVTGAALVAFALIALAGCIPTDPDDLMTVELVNDLDHDVVVQQCLPLGAPEDGERIDVDCDYHEEIDMDAGTSHDVVTVLSDVWRIEGTKKCLVTVYTEPGDLRSVDLSDARSCRQLSKDFYGGLCPDSASPDGWWSVPGEDTKDERECERARRKANRS